MKIFKIELRLITPRDTPMILLASIVGNKDERLGTIKTPPPRPKNELIRPTSKPVIINTKPVIILNLCSLMKLC